MQYFPSSKTNGSNTLTIWLNGESSLRDLKAGTEAIYVQVDLGAPLSRERRRRTVPSSSDLVLLSPSSTSLDGRLVSSTFEIGPETNRC